MSAGSSLNSGKTGRKGRSVLAVMVGLVTIIVLSLALDQIFRMLEVFPPAHVVMLEVGDLVLALSYRLVINTFGFWLAARLAPQNPMKHAMVLGWIVLALSMLGVVVAMVQAMAHLWYPVLLAASAPLCAWIGGRLPQRR